VKERIRISNKKNLQPYKWDSQKSLRILMSIRELSNLPMGTSPVCYAESDDVQQVYKDWKKK